MNNILDVTGLCKFYQSFQLNNVSFSLQKGKITGFIGRNGAGKSTTLNALLNFVHCDSGSINFFGKNFAENELEIKQKIGFVSGNVSFYENKSVQKIASVYKTFYKEWDEEKFRCYLNKFNLDENKKVSQLSTGMKIKFFLSLALSHNAQLLILDEPTSGLDPVSRDEILEIFLGLAEEGKTILFSTHITSDLEKCADNIVYIKNGRIVAESDINSFINNYKIITVSNSEELERYKKVLMGKRRTKNGFTALIKTEDANKVSLSAEKTDIDAIISHFENGVQYV